VTRTLPQPSSSLSPFPLPFPSPLSLSPLTPKTQPLKPRKQKKGAKDSAFILYQKISFSHIGTFLRRLTSVTHAEISDSELASATRTLAVMGQPIWFCGTVTVLSGNQSQRMDGWVVFWIWIGIGILKGDGGGRGKLLRNYYRIWTELGRWRSKVRASRLL
jgi:hypothetical protein